MRCVHCGICCMTMSPKSAPFPCPFLVRRGDIYFCGCYDSRPAICRNFNITDREYCPYALNRLRLSYPEDEAILEDRIARAAPIIAAYRQKTAAPE